MNLEQVIAEETAKAKRYKAQANFGWSFFPHKKLSQLECEENKYYAERHNQIAAWLRELQERRKESKTIKCLDCVHALTCNRRIDFGNGLFFTISSCSMAERRTNDNSRVDLS